MGCDIHGYVEVKQSSGVWIAFKEISVNRDYSWFATIAGVRGYGEQTHLHRRGIPDNPSMVWLDYCGISDILHSHTWLTPNETLDCFEEWLSDSLIECTGQPIGDVAAKRAKMCMFPEMPIKKLMFRYLGYDASIGRWGTDTYKELPWTGTIKDLLGDQDFETAVRMVVAFDN